MIVQVGRYAYETDLPVAVGDHVLLPSPDGLPIGERIDVVTALSSSYEGPCRKILCIVDTKKHARKHGETRK